jgi:hypothetical protein
VNEAHPDWCTQVWISEFLVIESEHTAVAMRLNSGNFEEDKTGHSQYLSLDLV